MDITADLECVLGQRRIDEEGKEVYSIVHLETKDDRRVDLRQILIDKGLAVSAVDAVPAIATAPAAAAVPAETTSAPAVPAAVVVERVVEGNRGANASEFVVGVTSVSAFSPGTMHIQTSSNYKMLIKKSNHPHSPGQTHGPNGLKFCMQGSIG